jgi:hypothetical protein
MMEYKLTTKCQHAKKLKNGKIRTLLLYFLNNVLIFKQKLPFDEQRDYGYGKVHITDEYLLNNKIHQTRFAEYDDPKRYVSYPVSKKVLSQFEIPTDLKIYAD